MTNNAIVSHIDYPAEVIATINVGTLGLHENFISKIKVYPNPANDNLFIESKGFVTIKIYDMLGKEVLNQNADGKTEIDISHLSKGVYNVQIFSEDIDRSFAQGNIYKDDFLDIWENRFEVMRNRNWCKSGICKNCKDFKHCKGGAMHLWNEKQDCIMTCTAQKVKN
ncbi:MAG: T9SS type A sorting domain-containing protein [Lentimicrobiaceae bacterium]|nr:T9SS type A sorting domain-containing protein [Lentimicrobiaceae bacterium]